MGLYGKLFPHLYGRLIAASDRAGLAERRSEVLSQARGDVLELGAGTGASIAHYPSSIDRLVLSEPDLGMVAMLEHRLADHDIGAEVVVASVEELPFPDDSFDTVVSALVLCTVPDQGVALREVRRILRPGGRLLFLEHVRAREAQLARWQDRLNWFQRRIGCGCNCNRDTLAAVHGAGFEIDQVEHGRFPKSYKIVEPMIWGRAHA